MSVVAANAHAELVESLDLRVREAVRREGVDPQRDAFVVRRLAEDVVRAHDQRSLTGVVAPVSDVESMVGELVARVSGFGPLQEFLDDPTVEEVWINDPLVRRLPCVSQASSVSGVRRSSGGASERDMRASGPGATQPHRPGAQRPGAG
jgi:pilus assembly protein CpaF